MGGSYIIRGTYYAKSENPRRGTPSEEIVPPETNKFFGWSRSDMETELRSEGLLSRIVGYSISMDFTVGCWELDKVSGENVLKTSE